MIKKIFLIMMAVIMVASLTVGCSTNDESVSKGETDGNNSPKINETSENETENDDAEKEIDEIIICEGWDINTGFVPVFNPNLGYGAFYWLGNFYETLVNYDNGEIKPGLAESWKVNDNEITFNLRQGIKFTDGSDFNAEVVKKNFEMIYKTMGEEYCNTFTILARLKEIKIINDYEVKFILTEPYYEVLQEIASVRPMGMMSLNGYTEEGLSDEVYTKTFGTGKYMIENAVQGEDYTFVRNENYWGEKPKVKQFVVKTIPDMESRIMALRSGEIDMIFSANNITYDVFSEFEDDNKFAAKSSDDRVMTRYFVLNTTKAPFDDKNVRLAAQYAIDKQSIQNFRIKIPVKF